MSPPPPRTICLTVAYDGTAYCGWQVQPNGTSIQAVLEAALADLTGETIRVTASGRTDAGVHAAGQLVSFDTRGTIPPQGFLFGLTNRLPADIVIREAVEQPFGFSARYDCVRKRYRYVIHASRVPWPWLRSQVWWHRGSLDAAVMNEAAAILVGTHDFRSFETEWPNKLTSVRTVFESRVWTTSEWSAWQPSSSPAAQKQPGCSTTADFLCYDIVADGFLYNMVRSIVGTLVPVGRGRWTPDDMRRILHQQNRRQAGDTAPARGLYLVEVETVVDPERITSRRERLNSRGVPTIAESGPQFA